MVVMTYRTQDRIADFGFSLEFQSETGWRVYIIFSHLQGNGQYRRFPYQSMDRSGRHYVDWAARIESLGEARIVAELWADIAGCHQRIEARKQNDEAAANEARTNEPATPMQPRSDAA